MLLFSSFYRYEEETYDSEGTIWLYTRWDLFIEHVNYVVSMFVI